MANRIIPNTFLKVEAVCGVILFANQSIDLSKKNIMIALAMMPPNMLIVSNSAFREIMVVKVPAPANNGKAMGTILPLEASPASSLKSLIPRIISKPMKSITIDPAKAKDEISIPNRPRIEAPKNRKAIMIPVANTVTTEGLNATPSFLMLINTGILPSMSMTLNKITVTDNNAVKFIVHVFHYK